MNKLSLILCLASVLVSAGLVSPLLSGTERVQQLDIRMPEEGPTERMYFYSASGDERALIALHKKLVAQGAKHVNCFLPNTVVCELPAGVSAYSLVASPDIKVLTEAEVDEFEVPNPEFGPKWVKQCYALAEEQLEEELGPALGPPAGSYAGELGGLGESILPVPEETVRRTQIAARSGYPDPRNIQQNSELLLGTILVQMIFPESSPHPLHKEDWTDASLAAAAGEAQAALMYFQNKFERVPMNFIVRRYDRAYTVLEPIKEDLKDPVWIRDVMSKLGYEDDGSPDWDLTVVHQFNNEKREELGTNWVFTVFIVNAQRDGDHMFELPKTVGWVHMGGPYFVVPYPAGSFMMGQAFKLYMGAIFWALGEDPKSGYGCDHYSGYLDYQNRNKTKGYDPETGSPQGCKGMGFPAPCIMNAVDCLEYYYSGDPCLYTAGMFGLADEKPRNGVPDCLDNPPKVYFENAAVETVFTSNMTLKFRVVSEGVPNENPWQTAAPRVNYTVPIKSVDRALGGYFTHRLRPLDGVYDELEEEFEYTFETLPGGPSEFSVITRNTANAKSGWQTKQIYYIGVTYLHYGYQNKNDGTVLSWDILGETFDARFDVHRIDLEGDGVDVVIAADLKPSGPPRDSFTPFRFYDKNIERGCLYRYYVKGTFTTTYRDADTTITVQARDLETRAMYPIASTSLISEAVPNPFRDRSMISVKVPLSYRNPDAEFPTPIPTDVDVTIYDVLGRRVRNLFSDTVFGQVITMPWDGTNDNNVPVPAGVYFVKVVAGAQEDARKVVVVR